MSSDEYDVIVIGAGPAGEVAAGRLAAGGLSVAVVEDRLVGGECSYWGCIPSKTLLRPGEVLAAARRVPGAAAAVTGELDVAAALARRDDMTSSWDDAGQVDWLADAGVSLVRGRGRLTAERTVAVADRELRARTAVVLATGTTPLVPPVDGLAEAKPWDNRAAMEATAIPRRLVVLGGGAVGVELAQAFRRLGAGEVTVIEGGERLLAREEPFAGAQVRAAFEAEGITVRVGGHATAVARPEPGGEVTVTLDDGSQVAGDELLVAVGRRPATADLGLERVGLEPGRPVEVDDTMRVAGSDWLYAVGDVNGRALLTHMGKYHARIAADVILGRPTSDRASTSAVPRVTFTDPQVCAVGLTEAQARDSYDDVRTVEYGTGDVAGASTAGEGISGTSKLVVDARRGVVVGATFTGPGLAELLHSATIAIVAEVPVETLMHAVPSFPTVSEVWLRLLEAYGL